MPLSIVQQKYNKAIPRNARWLYLKDNGLFQGDGIGCLALLLADHIGVNLRGSDASVRKHL